MPGTKKRGLSGGFDGVEQNKIIQTTTPLLSAPRPHRPPSHFTVQVRCPSKDKAKRNDWKPPMTMEELRRKLAAGTASGDGTILVDEEERGVSKGDEDEDDVLDLNHSLYQKYDYLEPLNGKVTLTPPGASKFELQGIAIGRGHDEIIRRGRIRCSSGRV